MTHPTNPTALKVKRDGPRGWHWIAAENYDPAVHEIVEGEAPARAEAEPRTAAEPAPKPAPKPSRRKAVKK